MEDHYVLIRWPESQDYMELEGVVLANDEEFGPAAYFVPRHLVEAQ